MVQHQFIPTTFLQPIYCNHCSKLLWGVFKQGLKCSDCGYICHFKCVYQISDDCDQSLLPPKKEEDDVETSKPHRDFSMQGSKVFRKQASQPSLQVPAPSVQPITYYPPKSSNQNETSSSETSSLSSSSFNQSQEFNPPGQINTNHNEDLSSQRNESPHFENVIEQLRKTAEKLNHEKSLVASPPLDLLSTTPKNFSKFIQKVGPLAEFHHFIEGLISWKHPKDTLIFLFFYVFLCLYPYFLFVLPQVIILSYLIYQSMKIIQEKKNNQEDYVIRNVSSELQDSIDYRKNLQYVQNVMSFYCDIHQQLTQLKRKFFSKKLQQSSELLLMLIISIPLSLLLAYSIPWNLICLVLGVGLLLSKTTLFQAILQTLTPILAFHLQNQMINVKVALRRKKLLPEGSITKKITIYENQRWWVGVGWANMLWLTERPSWSDEVGTIRYPPRDSFEPPYGYQWATPNWKLETDWVPVPLFDREGWIYYNTNWKLPKSTPNAFTVTRRRAWSRKLRKLDTSLSDALEEMVEKSQRENHLRKRDSVSSMASKS